MKKNRIFIVILSLCLVVFCLSACGKSSGNSTGESKQTEKSSSIASDKVKSAKSEKSGKSEKSKKTEKTKNSGKSKNTKKPAKAGKSGVQTPSACGKLSVKGTQLVDENGKAVQLRGLSTHGLSFYPQYVNEALFGQLHRDWKANVIRLAMYTAESGGYCTGGDKEKLRDLVRRGVEYATRQDMYVIVDWHILSDGNPNQHKAEAIDFFKRMSKEFSGYDNVIYEICNEPNGGTSWRDIKSYASEVIPVIRANAPDAVILVGTPNWSQYVNEAAADPITGYDNIMYTLHFYAATHKDDLRNKMKAAINAGLPVFVSEYGICDASGNGGIDKAQADAWVQVMNQYNVSYVAWNISNKNETSAIIKSSVSKTSGFTEADLSESGKWLYKTLTGGALPKGGSTAQPVQSSKSTTKSSSQNTTKSSGQSTTKSSTQKVAQNGDLEITAALVNSWETDGKRFYQYTLTIKNISKQSCNSWKADLKFSGDISLSDGWNGKYSVQGNTLHISSMDYNGQISAGGSVQNVGFIISGAAGLTIRS